MSGVVEFLLARIAEDEADALSATPGGWTVDSETYPETIYAGDGYTGVVAGGRWGGEASVFEAPGDAQHVARHDPARVLADVAAKRRIAEMQTCDNAPDCGDHDCITVIDVVRTLATTYSSHSDYDKAWRP